MPKKKLRDAQAQAPNGTTPRRRPGHRPPRPRAEATTAIRHNVAQTPQPTPFYTRATRNLRQWVGPRTILFAILVMIIFIAYAFSMMGRRWNTFVWEGEGFM